MSGIPASLSEDIQRRIDRLETDGIANWVVRACKEKLNALPLQANGVYQWALRTDGTVLCLDFESFTLPYEEELNPIARYAVLFEAARRYPELRELEPERPAGVQRCESCGGSGWIEATGAACSTCYGLGWHMQHRPIAEWLGRIDVGDRLDLREHGGTRRLVAGRIAGLYVARGGDLDFWCSPATAAGRRELGSHLRKFAMGFVSRPYQKHVTATWEPNPTPAVDPFESLEHSLKFHGTDSGGSYEMDIARQPDGSYAVSETLSNDWDPLGSAAPTTLTRLLDAAAARAELEREMRRPGRWSPFPAIVPRHT
ncbi:MAG TPA: hypothetical protein VEX86_15660 [Longimicrobium sp.]|nr:hypothetical protein [Longimicrobium sp.]